MEQHGHEVGLAVRPLPRLRGRRERDARELLAGGDAHFPRRVADMNPHAATLTTHAPARGDELDAHPLVQGREEALVHGDLQQERAVHAPGQPGQQGRVVVRLRAHEAGIAVRSRPFGQGRRGIGTGGDDPVPPPEREHEIGIGGAHGFEVAVERSARARVVPRHVGEGRFRAGAEEGRPAVHLRGHDVRRHQAGEEDTREPEQEQHQDERHDRDEEIRHEELGADTPEEATHEIAAQAHEPPGEVDEQDAAGEDVEAAGKGRARALGRVEGEGGEQDAAGPALQEEPLHPRAEAAIRTFGRWREEAEARHGRVSSAVRSARTITRAFRPPPL